MYQAIYIQQGENYAKTVHLRDDNEGWLHFDFLATHFCDIPEFSMHILAITIS